MDRALRGAHRVLASCLVAGAAASGGLAFAAPVEVGYTVDEHLGSWQPLDPRDIEPAIEHAALEVLSRSGGLRLERLSSTSSEVALKTAYILEIHGRLLEEAQTHSVYLRFRPGTASDLPSFDASDTVSLAGKTRGAMLGAIDASARAAAGRLAEVLRPEIDRTRADDQIPPPRPGPPDGDRPLPWRWPEVQVPRVSMKAAQDLYAKDPAARARALRVLTSLALADDRPRRALEGCTLQHPDASMRLGCLRALRPLSRRLPPSQRVVVEAFRRDGEADVVKEASEQMTFFTGLGRVEAAQAWLERASRGEVYGPIDRLGDAPNLDLVIVRCLYACGQRPKYQRGKSACLELLRPLSVERRQRILAPFLDEPDPDSPRYLEGAGAREDSIGTDWQRAVEAVLDGARTWDRHLEDVLWSRYQRTLSASSLDILSEIADPSPRLMDRMVEVVQTAGARQGISGLRRIAREAPELAPRIRDRIDELLATNAFPKTLSPQDLERLSKELAGGHR